MINKNQFKKIVRKIPPFSWINLLRKVIIDKKLSRLRAPYITKLQELLDKDTSIISSNCFAGRIMQDLGMEYNTPTLGLWIMPDDFSKLCANLRKYMAMEPKLLEHSKNALGEEKHANPSSHHDYPMGQLGDVEIHFLHYHTPEEAFSKWKRRAERINYDKLLFIGMEQNGCTEDDVRAFDALPYKNKIFFCSQPYPYSSVIYIPEFDGLGHVGDPYKQGYIFYRYLTNWLENQQKSNCNL